MSRWCRVGLLLITTLGCTERDERPLWKVAQVPTAVVRYKEGVVAYVANEYVAPTYVSPNGKREFAAPPGAIFGVLATCDDGAELRAIMTGPNKRQTLVRWNGAEWVDVAEMPTGHWDAVYCRGDVAVAIGSDTPQGTRHDPIHGWRELPPLPDFDTMHPTIETCVLTERRTLLCGASRGEWGGVWLFLPDVNPEGEWQSRETALIPDQVVSGDAYICSRAGEVYGSGDEWAVRCAPEEGFFDCDGDACAGVLREGGRGTDFRSFEGDAHLLGIQGGAAVLFMAPVRMELTRHMSVGTKATGVDCLATSADGAIWQCAEGGVQRKAATAAKWEYVALFP